MSAIAFRVRITVKIGVRVYTTLTAMQSLACTRQLFVFACAHVYFHFLFYFCMYYIIIIIISHIILYYYIISHIPLVAPPSIVSCQTQSWWSLEYLC